MNRTFWKKGEAFDLSWLDEEEKQPKGLKPRYGGPVSCVDPDTGEEVGAPSPIPDSLLAKEMLESVRPGNARFHSDREAIAWYKLEGNPPWEVASLGEWHEWIRNRLWCARTFQMSYAKLMRAIRNQDKFREWRKRYAKDI